MNGCPFCDRIAAGEFDSESEAVYDFEPLNPVTPGHRLFVPKEHVEQAGAMPGVTGRVFKVAARWASEHHEAFNLITSAGVLATQTVPHLHIHYVPRRTDDGLHLPWTVVSKWPPCTVPSCTRPATKGSRQICTGHLARLHRNGELLPEIPLGDLRKADPDQKNLYIVDEQTGCWIWTGTKNERGYGAYTPSGRRKPVKAHRFMYEKHVGPIPQGLEIDHLCCNRSCVNPVHLEPVTHLENVRRSRAYKSGRVEEAKNDA